MSRSIFRKTDGYVELTAVPEGPLVEIFVTSPGEHDSVTAAHFSDKLAIRLALWILRYWILDRWCGLRGRMEARKHRQQLLIAAESEDLNRT